MKCYFIICVRCTICNDTYSGKVYPLRELLLKTQTAVKVRYMIRGNLRDYRIACRRISPVHLGVNYTALTCTLLPPRDVFYTAMVYVHHYRTYGAVCVVHVECICVKLL